MNFLAPLFALGALAIIGPIVFHLMRHTTREQTPFSALMFLEPSPPRMTKRSKLENFGLLLLRCLVLALLALAFTRPFIPRPTAELPPAGGRRIVILLDTSASMRREKLWEEARSRAEARVRAAAPADEIAIVAFDRQTQSAMSFEEWRKLPIRQRASTALGRLAALKPGWADTRLDDALLRAVETLDQAGDAEPGRREIVVISDLQEGAKLSGLQGYQWPLGMIVTLDPVVANGRQNASVQWISEMEDAETPGEDPPIRLRVTNAADSKREQFQLRWKSDGSSPRAPLDVYAPAGQSRIVRAPSPPAGATAIALSGDDTDFDNILYVVPPHAAQFPILFVGLDEDDDPHGSLYYLLRAFPRTARQNIQITAHRTGDAVPGFQLQQAQLLVLGDTPGEAALASARQFAREGKIVVAPLASAAGAQTVARLLELPALSADEAPVKDYSLLAQIDFSHPLFAAFADPRYSDFTKIHWWKHRRLAMAPLAGAKILAAFDDKDPAIVQAPLGKGSVVLLTSTWRPGDSQLALSSKFVPMLQALLEQSSNLPPQKAQYFVGEELPLPGGSQKLTVRKPDGTEIPAAPGSRFSDTDQPGIYFVSPGAQRFVVNLAPEESRLAPLPPERFASLGVPLGATREESEAATRRERQAQAAEIEARQKLWRWLILAVIGLLLLETLFARKLSHSSGSSTVAPT
jgi:Aerotolerance regulator N-terminal/von Willebrand factor type A domain